jgi:GNAT superfamily N-acetyltransferase
VISRGIDPPAGHLFPRCVAFLCGFAARRAARTVQFPYGFAAFDEALRRAWDLNSLWICRAAETTALDLEAEADRLQGSAGLDHRKVVVLTPTVRNLRAGFVALGWRAQMRLVMPQVEPSSAPRGETNVVELQPADLEPFWIEGISQAPWADDETVRQLVKAQHARRRGALVRYFGVMRDGAIASTCELFSWGSVAQVESVITVERHRRRGLAGAVVRRAVAEARASGVDLVFLLVNESDGPQTLYRKLGFACAGRIGEFTRPAP